MENPPIKILYTVLGTFISKIEELPGRDIGEPDCALIDPCMWDFNHHAHAHDENGNHIESDDVPKFIVERFPAKIASPDRKLAILSSNIYTMAEPSQALLSEYLIAISD